MRAYPSCQVLPGPSRYEQVGVVHGLPKLRIEAFLQNDHPHRREIRNGIELKEDPERFRRLYNEIGPREALAQVTPLEIYLADRLGARYLCPNAAQTSRLESRQQMAADREGLVPS